MPQIWLVLRSDDMVWKYWVIARLIGSLPREVALPFQPELERLAYRPEPVERREELHEVALEALEHLGWSKPDPLLSVKP